MEQKAALGHYHLHTDYKSKGYAKQHAEYICREGKYKKLKKGEMLVHTESGNLPEFAGGNPVNFFAAADKYEREDGRAARIIRVALSNKLSHEEMVELVRDFVKKEIGTKYAYCFAIHDKNAALDKTQKQPHAHIMFSERLLDGIERSDSQFFRRANTKKPERGGNKKSEEWNPMDKLPKVRKLWENMQNEYFEQKGIDVRVDCRSIKAMREEAIIQGDEAKAALYDRTPAGKIGYIGYKLKNIRNDQIQTLEWDTNQFLRFKLAKEYQQHKRTLESIYLLEIQKRKIEDVVISVKEANKRINEALKENSFNFSERNQRIKDIERRKNIIYRQLSSEAVTSTILNIFSKGEYKKNKNRYHDLEKQLKNVDQKISDLNAGKYAQMKIEDLELRKNELDKSKALHQNDKRKVSEIEKEIKNISQKIKDLKDIRDNKLSLEILTIKRAEIIDKSRVIVEVDKKIKEQVIKNVKPEKIELAKNNIMSKHYEKLSRLEKLEHSLVEQKEMLVKERAEFLAIKQDLKYEMETSIVIYRDRKRGTHTFSTNVRNGDISMSKGVRLNIKLYDERERTY